MAAIRFVKGHQIRELPGHILAHSQGDLLSQKRGNHLSLGVFVEVLQVKLVRHQIVAELFFSQLQQRRFPNFVCEALPIVNPKVGVGGVRHESGKTGCLRHRRQVAGRGRDRGRITGNRLEGNFF